MQNDFLSSLYARASRAAATDAAAGILRPRLPSLFEPPVLAGMPALGAAPREDGLEEVETLPAAPTRPMPQDEGSAPVSPLPQIQAVEPARFVRREQSQPSHAQPETGETGDPARSAQPATAPLVAPQPAVFTGLEQIIESLRQQIHPAAEMNPGGQPEAPLQPAPAGQPAENVGNRENGRVMPEQIAITRLEPRPLQAAEPPRLIPASAARERKPPAAAPTVEPQAPIIHVTIGRIEVRANPGAAAPKRAAPASTTMSLEEYLRRRQGGSR